MKGRIMDAPFKTVSIITINMDGKEHLKGLLQSIELLEYPKDKFEVIVVDNASKDGSVDYLEREHPEVRIIRNKSNLGFAYPCNQAASAATGECLAFVNNDVRLEPSWLREMASCIDPATNTLCVASKILNADGSKIDFIGGGINYFGFGYQDHFRKDAGSYGESEKKDLLFACGGAMLIDSKTFLHIGGFDADYFAFFEDVDLGWRLWVMGYRVVFAPRAIAYHHHHSTARRLPDQKKQMLYERNSLFTMYKNYDNENLNRLLPAAFIMRSQQVMGSYGMDLSNFLMDAQADGLAIRPIKKRNVFKRGYRAMMGRVLDVISSMLLDFRLKSRTCESRRKKTIKLTPMAATVHFGLNHKKMRLKRDFIQANRKREDREIFELFKKSIIDVKVSPSNDALWKTIKDSWDIDAIFSGGK